MPSYAKKRYEEKHEKNSTWEKWQDEFVGSRYNDRTTVIQLDTHTHAHSLAFALQLFIHIAAVGLRRRRAYAALPVRGKTFFHCCPRAFPPSYFIYSATKLPTTREKQGKEQQTKCQSDAHICRRQRASLL